VTSTDDANPPPKGTSPSTDAVLRTVRELEQHVSADGWDGPCRLFALIRTAGALEHDPSLEATLPPEIIAAARADSDHLTAVEQENLPKEESIDSLLRRITWPPTVDGAALVVERLVLPPEVEEDLPDGEDEALAYAQDHPQRREVRLAAAVLRDGAHGCAVRARDHDSDDRVAVGCDLIPGLVEALDATLRDDDPAM
jgi:hypothetical protein